MAINVPGSTFIDKKGIEYVLKLGPKGNLRPYAIGLAAAVTKSRNPYLIGGALIVGTAIAVGYWYRNKSNTNDAKT